MAHAADCEQFQTKVRPDWGPLCARCAYEKDPAYFSLWEFKRADAVHKDGWSLCCTKHRERVQACRAQMEGTLQPAVAPPPGLPTSIPSQSPQASDGAQQSDPEGLPAALLLELVALRNAVVALTQRVARLEAIQGGFVETYLG